MQEIIPKCLPGKSVCEIIKAGEVSVAEKLSKVYTNKKLDKGFAFPICISVNHICAYFSPIKEDDYILK